MTPNDEVLNSWKEVASYLGRGVRTVQRWEQELGLPVRRPRGKSRSAVIAFKSELDTWLHHAPAEHLNQEPRTNGAAVLPLKPRKSVNQNKLHENTELLIAKMHLLLSRSTSLCEQLQSLRQRVDRTVELTTLNITRKNKNSHVLTAPPPAERDKIAASNSQTANKHRAIAS